MEKPVHHISKLFAQLGEPSDDRSIARFIEAHSPMPSDQRLHEAPFWSPSQAGFLREALAQDADWAEVVDELNVELHKHH